MIRVAGGPILEYTLKSLHQAGFREIMMVVNHEQEGIRAHFGSGDHLNLNLEYVVQESPKGLEMLCGPADPGLKMSPSA